jgi:hypothetical protein
MTDEVNTTLERMGQAKLRPLVGQSLGDRSGVFGSVVAALYVKGPMQARALRAALWRGLDKAPSPEEASVINGWLDDVESMLRRAASEHWTGWETVHAAGDPS